MRYEKIQEAIFLERPNRFIAKVKIGDRQEVVHVKNTGRCKELLPYGAKVYLSDEEGKERKTRYDLVAVEKQGRVVNMDSQAPNQVVKEALEQGRLLQDILEIRPETKYGDSRFDFYVKTKEKEIFIEVKGVTLEEDNICAFPDAPSVRAVKHLEELIKAKGEGYEGYIIFVIQINGVECLHPNEVTHKAFSDGLRKAKEAGITILAYDCLVTPKQLMLNQPVPVYLNFKKELLQMVSPLMSWYRAGHRRLPWREAPTGYNVWISEIMLQQTRVEAVKPYYTRFMEELPDIAALAKVPRERLLKLWEGLGYYNRARNLQRAAEIIMEDYHGEMPVQWEELQRLPGIGSYTAGAISSIAYGQCAPAVDGNVLRILSRLTMDEEEITREKTKKRVERQILEIIPKDCPGEFNQALMELGAMICIPGGKPKCESCPWENICLAHREGREEEFPKREAKKTRNTEEKTVLIIEDDRRYVLHKRPDTGLLAGMYQFPMLEGHPGKKRVLSYLKEIGMEILQIKKLEPSKHVFSHKEWHMEAYFIRTDELIPKDDILKNREWVLADRRKAQEEYPLPSAFSAYTRYLNIVQGSDGIKEK